jgi:protein-tyrosine-phosphatase
MKKILVVGSKNTYRSIILGEYLKKVFQEKEMSDIDVKCAGIMAFPGIPAEKEAVSQLELRGVSGAFVSSLLDKESVLDADIIITVSEKIKGAITGKFSDKSSCVFTAKELSGETGDITATESLGAEIKELVEKGMNKLM